MKKIMIVLLFILAFLWGSAVRAQQLKFYYYPQSNVYYDPVHKQYIYSNSGNWTTVKTLPSNSIADGSRVTVYSQSPDVWKMNAAHVKKYKNYPEGKAVGYKGTNPNKANGKAEHQKNGKSKGKD